MAKVMLVLPVPPGKSESWRRFIQELEETRYQEHAALRASLAISQEMVWLAQLPQAEIAVLYFETSQPDQLKRWLAGRWEQAGLPFLEQLHTPNERDLTKNRAGGLAELLLDWTAS